jgi:hypothetical protein
MAGLGLFDQKSALAVTMPIVTAFKFCIGHRKNGLLNRYPTEVLTRFLYREWCHQSLAGGPKKRFLRVAPGVGQNCPGTFHDALALFE